MPKFNRMFLFSLLAALLLASLLTPATALAQIPSDPVLCISSTDEFGNTSYALAWDTLLENADLYLFKGTDWVLETVIGQESGVYPLEDGFFPWMVPALGLEGTCGSLENPPTFQCSWEGSEFVFRWSGLTHLTRIDMVFGHDLLVPKYIGPEDGSIDVGLASDTYWYAPGFSLEGECTRGEYQIFLPVVKNH